MAAKLTRATDDPMDAQHLNIDSMRFIKDENWIHFEVKSTLEVEKKDTTAKKGTPPVKEKKIYFFNYNIITGELVQLNEFTKPKRRPTWANISPDSNIIIFGKNYNLWWMDKANYQKALVNEDDSTIVQYQLTKDGIENFSYYNEGNLSGN